MAINFVQQARDMGAATVVDLGCGAGGFLRYCRNLGMPAHGYDFTPAYQPLWQQNGVEAELLDVFNDPSAPVRWADVCVVTEVLEHLRDPHGAVTRISENCQFIVASSPWGETPEGFDECHVWGWDLDGYRALIEPHFEILEHRKAGWSQVILGRSNNR